MFIYFFAVVSKEYPTTRYRYVANIGVWGMRHKRYLKENHRVIYANLMTSGKLIAHLDEIEQQATALFLRVVKELAEKENVTEQLKSTNPNQPTKCCGCKR